MRYSYSPNLFGTDSAFQEWKRIAKVIGYDDPIHTLGTRPDMKAVVPSSLRKNKKRILEAITVPQKQRKLLNVVDGKYSPEGLLIVAFLFIGKGIHITSRLNALITLAIDTEREKLKNLKDKQKKSIRKTQLDHLERQLEQYMTRQYEGESTPLRVQLFHTPRTRKKMEALDRKRRKKEKQKVEQRKEMTLEDQRFYAYVYLFMRMLYGAREANEFFRTYAPRIDVAELRNYGFVYAFSDKKGRPTKLFRNRMIEFLKDYDPEAVKQGVRAKGQHR